MTRSRGCWRRNIRDCDDADARDNGRPRFRSRFQSPRPREGRLYLARRREASHRGVRSSCMLHPFGGNRTSWARHAPDLMATLAQDFIVVLPECGRGWFINDHAGKRYEDYLIGELIPLVRETYGAAGPACIGGFSMGGASAFFLALKHPDAFAAAFAVAGAFTAGNRAGDPYAAIRSDALLIPTEAEHDRVWGPPGSAVRAALRAGNAGRADRGPDAPAEVLFRGRQGRLSARLGGQRNHARAAGRRRRRIRVCPA